MRRFAVSDREPVKASDEAPKSILESRGWSMRLLVDRLEVAGNLGELKR